MPEAWLQGPIQGIDPGLQPAAHAFVQTRTDFHRAVEGLTPAELWARPGGVAAVAYHVLHVAGATDRLLTYARAEALSDAQRAFLASEKAETPERGPLDLLAVLDSAIESALAQLRRTARETLLDRREVGRDRLPSTVLGVLFHAAEHAQRHAGQATTTARLLRADATRVPR